MQNQFLFFFSALGGFNALLLSLYFAVQARKKNTSNYFLSALLFVLSIRIIKSVFFYFNPQLGNIFIQIGLSACILIGPFLFLYLKSSVKEKKVNWSIHFFSYLTLITTLGIVYPYVENRQIWVWIVWAIYAQWLAYIIVAYKFIHPILLKIKGKESLKKIDIWLLSIYLGVTIIWIAYYTANYTSYIVGALSFSFILYLIALLLIFRNNNEPAFFQEKEKYKNKLIPLETQEHIDLKLSIIADRELFVNPNFTLEDAAKELKVTKHILSQYLNEKLGKSFSNLINEYRIEKAKELLRNEKSHTVESIGYDSGFNSKSTFFTTFKKVTGLTPTEYQKNHSK
ncbi:AraC family transcriptional regulator [Dyadobacter luteus]|uniref:AraC family transcriptional regulator n=1 Tax=Dyadobacter luteus TaxID=2259619 RepID=A0A3D8YH90_9BACT|nr:AraC family transcriptional regulator [Dyadobacter luteus]